MKHGNLSNNTGRTRIWFAVGAETDFAVKDPAVIHQEVITDYETAFKTLTNVAKVLGPGDPVRLLLQVVCHWLIYQRTIIDFTGKQNLLKYAHGTYLDNLGALYGDRALRLAAQAATITLRFTLAAPLAFDVMIASGTRCQAPNAVKFATTADGILTLGAYHQSKWRLRQYRLV